MRLVTGVLIFSLVIITEYNNLFAQQDSVSFVKFGKVDSINSFRNKIAVKQLGLDNHKVNIYKFAGFSTFIIGAGAFLHNFQKHAWWSGQREKFHIQNDWSYAMSMDKLGHVFVAGFINRTMRDAYYWSGMSRSSAIWTGALISIGYMTDIEIEDGFAKEWGYSPGDELANITGDMLATAQDLWKPLQTVKLRWSYWPTNDPNHKGDFPDDYDGQTFWLSFSVHDYLSGNLQKIWPDYLNVALGYGVKQYDYYGPGGRIQNLYLSLDYDVRKIIPGSSSFMTWIKELLWNFKFIPAPALKYNTTTGKVDLVVHW